jgi:hypothetical protein
VFLTGLPGLNQPPVVTASEELRLNTNTAPCEPVTCSTYSTLGVIGGDNAGFPNGRRPADDVLDVALKVVVGGCLINNSCSTNTLTDGVNANDVSFQGTFPYLALPHSGSSVAPIRRAKI